MKKEVSINGRIAFPLQEGARAVISTGEGLIYRRRSYLHFGCCRDH